MVIKQCSEKANIEGEKSFESAQAARLEVSEVKITSPLNILIRKIVRINEGDYAIFGVEALRIIPDMIRRVKLKLITAR